MVTANATRCISFIGAASLLAASPANAQDAAVQPPPNKGTDGGAGVCKVPKIADPDDLAAILAEAAMKSGFGNNPQANARDPQADLKWNQALAQEAKVQTRLMKEFGYLQNDVARNMNRYLQASSSWQANYAHVASASTGLQGLLADWYESRAIYEKADLAFALANLATGVGKLGFKAVRWMVTAKKGAAAAQGAASALAASGEGAATLEKTAAQASADLGKTQVFNKVIVPPGAGMYTPIGAGGKVAYSAEKTGKFYEGAAISLEKMLAAAKAKGTSPWLISRIEAANNAVAAAKTGVSAGADLGVANARYAEQVGRLTKSLKKAMDEGASPEVLKYIDDALTKVIANPPSKFIKGGAAAVKTTAAATAAGTDAARLAAAQAKWEADVAKTIADIAKAKKAGAPSDIVRGYEETLAMLQNGKPTAQTIGKALTPLQQAEASLGDVEKAIAKSEGVDISAEVRSVIGKADDPEAIASANMKILAKIAAKRGWHDIPTWATTTINQALVEARVALGGAEGARISPKTVELLKSLKTYAESQGMSFSKWLETAGGEMIVTGDPIYGDGGVIIGYQQVTEGMALYYDKADVALLLKLVESGGDLSVLRTLVGPVSQVSMNALARNGSVLLTPIGGWCGQVADAGVTGFQVVAPASIAQMAGKVPNVSAGGGKGGAQAAQVLGATGELGQIGLGNIIDEFGVTDRLTAGQSIPRVMLGELWEVFTSPSATLASHYYTLTAQSEMMDLMKNEGTQLVQLGVQLDSASSALKDLEATLNKDNVTGPNSYLNKGGPDELRKALDNLERALNGANADWKREHQAEFDARRQHILQKLADLNSSLADLNALKSRIGLLRQWLDAVRVGPDGKPRSALDTFNPETFVRLGAINLYIRATAAAAFGLTEDRPFNLIIASNSGPAIRTDADIQSSPQQAANLFHNSPVGTTGPEPTKLAGQSGPAPSPEGPSYVPGRGPDVPLGGSGGRPIQSPKVPAGGQPSPTLGPTTPLGGSQSALPMQLSPFAEKMLDLHNAERRALGESPLRWDPTLASSASGYAAELARTGVLTHSARQGRENQRENLLQARRGESPERMMSTWTKEKQNFSPGTFPNVTRTGNWADVAHYTQMIWPSTTSVGCAVATAGAYSWLVCRYSPPGNADGKHVP